MSKTSFLFGVIDDYWLTVYCLWKIIPEMWTFKITLLNRKKNFKSDVSNWRCCIWRRKITWFGMVFKQCIKCLKNKKVNFSPAILKLETLLYQNICIYYFILYYIRRAILIQKKSGLREKKNMPYNTFSLAMTN